MEKLEQEMNAPEKMAETPSPKKTAGKKKKFRKNQVIITALAIMIAVAGYINYADSTLSTKEKADGTTADASTVLKDISSLDTDITDVCYDSRQTRWMPAQQGTRRGPSPKRRERQSLPGHLHTWPRPESTANRSVPRTKTP